MSFEPKTEEDLWQLQPRKAVDTPLTQAQPRVEIIDDVTPLDAKIGAFEAKTVPEKLQNVLFGQLGLTQDRPTAAHTYAVLDGAKIANLPELLANSDLEHRCLFNGAAYDELKNVAPWIVRLEEGNRFTRNLFIRSDAPWHLWGDRQGIYIRSEKPLEELKGHFRKFNKVRDEAGNWLYLRWWEPNFWYLASSGSLEKVQHNLAAQVNALVIPQDIPIFGNRWVAVHMNDRSVAGEQRLDSEAMENIRLTTNLRDCLQVLNYIARPRFKGLGFNRTTRFVRHALAASEQFGLQYRDQTAYLMFIMNFIGSWFWLDPRFRNLADILYSSELSSHRKIEKLHAAFSRFSSNFIGDDYALYWSAIAKAELALPPLLESDASDNMVLRTQMECHGRPEIIHYFPADSFLDCSRRAAEALEMDSHKGYQASAILSYWFGTNYHNDPLFPWIAEKAAEQKTANTRAREIMAYALKRMKKTRKMGGHDVQ